MSEDTPDNAGCARCAGDRELEIPISMAFQPIIEWDSFEVWAYESLVRTADGGSAASVFEQVTPENQYRFDQACRVKAIELAASLQIESRLSINFLPNAVYEPERCLATTLAAAERFGFPSDRIVFEVTEVEEVRSAAHLRRIIEYYQKRGFLTAIDDFGAGYAGLSLLADFQPDLVKLDMSLVRDIHNDRNRQAIVRGIQAVCESMNIRMIGEGIENIEEALALHDMGIELFQGYLFARPGFESLPPVDPAVLDRQDRTA